MLFCCRRRDLRESPEGGGSWSFGRALVDVLSPTLGAGHSMNLSPHFVLAIVLLLLVKVKDGRAEGSFTNFTFIDTYYALSESSLGGVNRPYVTQSAKSNQYQLNLAAVGTFYEDTRLRAKLVGQFGDSVDLNYGAEAERSWRYLQEFYIGYRFNESTVVDAGTFLAHIGAESWLSKDNPTYTRSLIAEFSPYYETGVRLSHTFDNRWSSQLLLLNGWQNTTDDRHPALGTQVTYSRGDLTLSSNTFVGEENYGNRLFHNFIASHRVESGRWLIGSLDVGHQSGPTSGTWWGMVFTGSHPIRERLSLNGRFEYYSDRNNVIVPVPSGAPFRAYGASMGLDLELGGGFFLRGEAKRLWSDKNVFQGESSDDTLLVFSFSYLDE